MQAARTAGRRHGAASLVRERRLWHDGHRRARRPLALLPRGDHDGHYAYIGIFYTRRMLVQFKFRRLFSTPYYCLLIERTHEGGLA